MSLPESISKVFKKIDENKAKYITNLRDAVAIQSVSAWPHKRDQIRKMVEWVQERCKKLSVETQIKELGTQTLPDGNTIPLPPESDPKKKTVLIYGHLDVQPALLEDGWDSEPFVLTERGDKLYGRGSSDDKGPVLGWLHAIEAFQEVNVEVPVNIKFVFEGMEESGSVGLEELLKKEKNGFYLVLIMCVFLITIGSALRNLA
ncbi:hypothetical protein NQ317_012808 [Molorchus minor]|uniref:Cytosolic non-specific dipeptidase n=1 Tax=Molorchus minor TaxID=1323400 RepID=A0ABQ9K3G9_9CUCU|nr:hypothetical protein NQ317_012808 [Molorchus minor]